MVGVSPIIGVRVDVGNSYAMSRAKDDVLIAAIDGRRALIYDLSTLVGIRRRA
jgi:hypothetical protein